jgi:hypothetical protein
MPIDPRISLGVQPIQVADPIARYGQLQLFKTRKIKMRWRNTN